MNDEFKYPLNTVLQKSLAEYRIIGHIKFNDGTRGYIVNCWSPTMQAGYSQMNWDATETEMAEFSKVTLPQV
jgi:hypothetical protein